MMAFAVSSRLSASVALADPSVASAERVNSKQPDLSQGDFPGLPADLHGIRRCFPDRWADFLRSHFRNHQHVAVFFGVNSAPVIFALRSIPGAVAELLEAA